MDFRGGRRRGEDSIAMVIDFLLANARLVLGVGGAAILGIATLAVKRLIERAGSAAEDEKVEQKMTESWEELSLGPSPSRKSLEDVVLKHVSTATRQQKGDLCQQQKSILECVNPPSQAELGSKPSRVQLCAPLSLQDQLQQYYSSRVLVSPQEVLWAQRLCVDVCTEIQGFLLSTHPDMPLGEFSLGGALLDDLEAVRVDHVCVLVPLRVEAGLWSLVPGEQTLLKQPLSWMVRRTSLEYFPRGRSYWDRFLVGGYLSSEALVNMLSKVVMETMNWPSLSNSLDCLVRPVLGGPELKLEVSPAPGCCVSGGGESLFVSLLPVLRQDDVVLCAQPGLTLPWPSAWRLSLYPWETQRLAQLDGQDGGVRGRLLKTLKAVCRLNPTLRPLTSAPLANLILHLSDKEPDWSEGALEGRFRQCVEELIGYLEQGAVPSYFKAGVNVLGGVSEEQVDQMGFLLYCALSDPGILLI
ncbi:mitochondrial dynamics protein MID49 [Osmerus mordax]|uniref:mitochondrial dynamics protein MID49 n=1 Tax=Osmerus mordax TaxID=8014 RepID=UPI00350FF6D6